MGRAVSEGLPPGREDPGPPPERGLLVRTTPDGYYLRIWPQPGWPALQMAGTAVGAAALGAAIGWWFSSNDPVMWVTIIVASVVFIGLLQLFAFGQHFFPVEVVVGATTINWDGERHALSTVADCAWADHRLELRAREGRLLGVIPHVRPEVGRWVSLAIRASLP